MLIYQKCDLIILGGINIENSVSNSFIDNMCAFSNCSNDAGRQGWRTYSRKW